MGEIKKFETLTLSNDKEYIVFDIVEKDNEKYLYLVNEIENEVMIATYKNEEIKIVEDEALLRTLAEEILSRIGE